jgi:hypothetical protein
MAVPYLTQKYRPEGFKNAAKFRARCAEDSYFATLTLGPSLSVML